MQPPATQRCAQCGRPLRPNQHFCEHCGTPVTPRAPARCTRCGAVLTADTRFCEQCGQPVTPAAAFAPTVVNPNRPAPVAPAPTARRGKGCQIAVGVLGLLGLLLVGGGVVLWPSVRPLLPFVATPVPPSPVPTFAPLPLPPDGGVSAPPPLSATPATDALAPKRFMPTPGLRMRFHVNWPDGTRGEVALVTARLGGANSVSSAELVLDAQGATTTGFGAHLVARADGIESVEDASPDSPTLWLPQDLRRGATWTAPGVKLRVVAVNTLCDLPAVPDIPAKGCIVIGRNFTEAAYQDELVIAPGYGVIRTRDPATGQPTRELRAAETLDANEAATLVRTYAPNAAQALR